MELDAQCADQEGRLMMPDWMNGFMTGMMPGWMS
jgi:hypothetical protein